MPELPEVETVRAGLAGSITGAVIKNVTQRRKDLRVPFPKNFVSALTGRTIKSISRRAKYLLFSLDSGDVVIAHLGMSGRFSVHDKKPEMTVHDHLVIELEGGRCLVFNDARRFGLMTLTRAEKLLEHPLFAHLGPEPLSAEFSPQYLENALKRCKMAIKPTIMDQELVVGVGNIYASEALFDCGIDPRKPSEKAAKMAPILVKSIQKILKSAIESGGSSLKDFLSVSGDSGYFQHRFMVYDRKGEPCYRCQTPIRSIRQSGRSTFFCPKCQK